MERSDFKYYVVQFLELPYKGIKEYVCVPSSWIVKRRATDRKVVVSYPVEDPSDTARRVKKRQTFSDDWKLYRCIQQCGTDLYADAKRYVKEKMKDVYYEHDSNIETEDQEISAEIEKNTSRSKRNAKSKHKKEKTLDLVGSSKNYDQCASKRLKRTALPNPDTEPASKRTNVVEPVGSDSEVEEQPCPAFECSNKNHSSAREDLQLENSAEKSDERTKHVENSTQKSQSLLINPLNSMNSSSDPQITVGPEFFTELFTVTRDLHTSSVRTYSLIELLRKTLIDNAEAMRDIKKFIAETRDSVRNTPTASSSKASPRVENISGEKTKEKPQEQDDNDDKVPKKKRNRKRNFVLPPEYDESDSRWTLKYRELAPGLVELMPHTSVYINAVKLSNCKRVSKDCKSLARMLLVEIFTKSALSTCSLTGSRARAYDDEGADIRPGLDEDARTVLLAFVEEHGREKGWTTVDAPSIQSSLRNKMNEMRIKYG